MQRIAVVIPSVRPGKVKNSVSSALAQAGVEVKNVFVSGDVCRDEIARKEIIVQGINVKCIVPPSEGKTLPGAARNLALDFITPEQFDYVLFLDDDITIPPDFTSTLIKFLDTNLQVGAVMGRVQTSPSSFIAKVIDYSNFWWLQVTKDITDLGWLGAGATLCRVADLGDLRFREDVLVGEDRELWERFSSQTGKKLGICSTTTALHNHERNTLSDLIRYQYANGRNLAKVYPSHSKSPLKFLGKVWRQTKHAISMNREFLLPRPWLCIGILFSFTVMVYAEYYGN